MRSTTDIALKLLGILLLTAAILKGWQLLTEPMANKDIWTNRAFLILTVEFEIGLGIWLLSGLFKKPAWLAAVSCFSMFSFITLYKGLTGAESCGCFGSVRVNPWITLFAVDIPACLALLAFRPRRHSERSVAQSKNLLALLQTLFTPLPSMHRLMATIFIAFLALGITTPLLAFNEPAKVTDSYEVLLPAEWIGKKLPILNDIDIAGRLKKGTWLVLFYHYDCPDCAIAIRTYQRNAADLAVSGHSEQSEESQTTNDYSPSTNDYLKIALVEVPPYGRSAVNNDSNITLGKLSHIKEWFITTPAVVLLDNGIVRNSWEEKTPELDAVLSSFAKLNKSSTSKIGP